MPSCRPKVHTAPGPQDSSPIQVLTEAAVSPWLPLTSCLSVCWSVLEGEEASGSQLPPSAPPHCHPRTPAACCPPAPAAATRGQVPPAGAPPGAGWQCASTSAPGPRPCFLGTDEELDCSCLPRIPLLPKPLPAVSPSEPVPRLPLSACRAELSWPPALCCPTWGPGLFLVKATSA